MEILPKSSVLNFPPDTLEVVRKNYNLDGPDRMKQAIDILDEWIKKQEHFIKKDFPRDYLEITLICNKGSIEQSKKRLDKVCTLRTFLKNLFGNYDLRNDFKNLIPEKFIMVPLPTLTKDYHRVSIFKFKKMVDAKELFDVYRVCIIYFEYLRVHDYVNGYITLTDWGDLNLLELTSKINITDLRHVMTTIVEGYGVRIKAIYQLSPSKLVDAFISLLKQVVNAKLGSRIHVVKTIEDWHEYVPKEILPKEYGGNEKSIEELHEDWIEELSSKEFTEYRKEINKACTDETLRPVDTFNDQYMGMPGTFRTLNVD